MDRLNPTQREKVKQFIAFTNTAEAYAIKQLQAYKWNTENAIAGYLDNPPPPEETGVLKSSKLDSLFDKYIEKGAKDTNKMTPEGFERFCSDVGISIDDLIALMVLYRLNAKEFYIVSREEFVSGWRSMGCEDTAAMKKYIAGQMKKQLADPSQFKAMYRYLFGIVKNASQKFLDLEHAIAMWEQLFPKNSLMGDMGDYMRNEYKRTVNKDLWNMMYDFASKYTKRSDLAAFDSDTVMYGTAIEEFVGYMKRKYPGDFPGTA